MDLHERTQQANPKPRAAGVDNNVEWKRSVDMCIKKIGYKYSALCL